jgi:dolichyl-phosphate beta-glucosyltransferase
MLHGGGNRLLMVDADGANKFSGSEKLWKALDKIAPGQNPTGAAVGSQAHLVKSEAVVKVMHFSFIAFKCLLNILG